MKRQWVATLLLFCCFVAAEAYLPVPEFGKEQYVDLPVKVACAISETAPNANLFGANLAVRSKPAGGVRRSILIVPLSDSFDPTAESIYKAELILSIQNIKAKSSVLVHAMRSETSVSSDTTWNCEVDTNTQNKMPNCAHQWKGGYFSSSSTAATAITPSENQVALDVTELVQSGATAFLLKAQDELGGVSDVEFHTADGSPQAPFLHITVPAIPPIVWPSKGCQDRYETVSWVNGEPLRYHMLQCNQTRVDPSKRQVNIMFLHGSPSNSFMWRNVLTPLTDIATVWAIDNLGAGLSSNPNPQKFDYLYESQAKALRILLDQLNLTNMVFVLEDWGSLLGVSYIVDRQDRVAGYVMWETLLRICGEEFELLGLCSSKYILPWFFKDIPLTLLLTHCFRIENYRCSECINIDLEYFFNALPDRARCYALDNMTVDDNEPGIGDWRYFMMPTPQFLTTRTLTKEEVLGYSRYADASKASRYAFSRWPFSLTDQSQTPFMLGLVERLLLLHAKLRKSVVPGRALQWPYPPFGNSFASIIDTYELRDAYPSIHTKEVHPWSGHFMAESFPFAVQREIRNFIQEEVWASSP